MKKSVRKQRKSLRNKRRNTKKHSRKTRMNTTRVGGNWFTTDPCKIVGHAKPVSDKHGNITAYSFNVGDPKVVSEVGYLTAANPLSVPEYTTKAAACNKIKAEKAQKNKPVIFTLPPAYEENPKT